MILQSIVELPRLYSGRDSRGRSWTTLFLPRGFSLALDEKTERQRASILKGLLSDMKTSGGDGGQL